MGETFSYRAAEDFSVRTVPAHLVERCGNFHVMREKAFGAGVVSHTIVRVIKDGWSFGVFALKEEGDIQRFVDYTDKVLSAEGLNDLLAGLDKGFVAGEFSIEETDAVEYLLKWQDELLNLAKVMMSDHFASSDLANDPSFQDMARERAALAVYRLWQHTFASRHPEVLEDPQVYSVVTAIEHYKALNADKQEQAA